MSEEKRQETAVEDVGTVVWAEGTQVRVELVRGAGCKSCSMRGMCFGRNTPAVFELETDLDLNVGDKVQLEIAPSTRVLSSLLVFGLPMLTLFVAFILASRWLVEIAAIGVAFGATALSFLMMKLIDKCFGNRLQVRIGSKINDNPAE